MSQTAYHVSGMTCGHCASAVSSEIGALPGVTDVDVTLVAGGTSLVTVTAEPALSAEQISEALSEAGNYQLVTTS